MDILDLSTFALLLDSQGRIRGWSRACQEAAGLPIDRVRGLRPWELAAASSEAETMRAAFGDLSDAQPRCFEAPWPLPGGARWVAWSTTPRLDASGRLAEIAAVGLDRTARRQGEAALRDREARASGICAIMPEAVVSVDPAQRITAFNPGAERMFGYQAKEVIGQPLDLLLPEGVRDAHRKQVQAFATGPACAKMMSGRPEIRGRRRDGTTFPAEASITRIAVAGESVLTALIRDISERLQVEEALRSSERLLNEVFGVLPVGLWITDDKGRIVSGNPAGQRIWGGARYVGVEQYGEYRGWWADSGEPIAADEWALARAVRRGETSLGEVVRIQCFDGSYKTVLNSAVPLRDDRGRITGAIVVNEDITERRRVEEALRDSEERFRTAFSDAPIGMALLDLQGRFLHVNRSLCQIVGYSEEELLARTFQDITYPDDLGADLGNMHRLLSGEIASYQMEKRYFHKEGSIIWIQLTGSVVRDARGRPLHFIAQIQDITEQKRAVEGERLLSRASAQLAVSLDPDVAAASVARLSVPALGDVCLLGLLDEGGQVHMVDAATAGSGTTERLREAVPGTGQGAWRGPAIEQALRTGVPVHLHGSAEETIAAISGEEGVLPLLRELGPRSCLIAPLIARRRTLGVLALLACDPHHRYDSRDAELAAAMGRRAALVLDNGRLFRASQEATRLRDEVLRVVAHDLRNPLNGILLSAESILRLAPSGPAAREPLERIRKLVMRANRLIQDLLDVARMEAGKLSVAARSEEVAPLVRDAVELHRVLADDRQIHLAVEVPDGLPSIHADRDRMLQALSNLLGNAIKFTPGGGRITVRAERAGAAVRISVIDTGPGISAGEIPHLFDPFWQARKGDREGAGLGLPIVKGLVEAHRGTIQVTSEVGAGSTFSMTLPAVPPAAVV